MFKANQKKLIILVATCVSLLVAASAILALRGASLNTLKLPLSVLTLARRELGGFFLFHKNLIEKELLRKEVDFLRSKLNSMNEMSQENARLKELLSFKQSSPLRVIATKVIGRSPDSWSSTVIVDKGRQSGVKQQMAAITYLGLVGRVVESTDFASKIMLINDPSLGVSAIVQRSRQEGLVAGTLGTHLIMRYLPEGADVKVGDVVVTSGLNALYPKGTLIGTVVEMGKEFSGLSTYAIIKPAVNLANIEEVFIVVQ